MFLFEDYSDSDAFEEDEVDYSASEYASRGSSKFFHSPAQIPTVGKLDLPSGGDLMAPPPPLGDSGKSASTAAPPVQHASSSGNSPVTSLVKGVICLHLIITQMFALNYFIFLRLALSKLVLFLMMT
jgi:hypothetical protein